MSNLDFAFWDAVSFADTGRHPADVFEQHIALAQERTAEYEEIVAYHLEQAHNHQVALGAADDLLDGLAAAATTRLASAGRRARDLGNVAVLRDRGTRPGQRLTHSDAGGASTGACPELLCSPGTFERSSARDGREECHAGHLWD